VVTSALLSFGIAVRVVPTVTVLVLIARKVVLLALELSRAPIAAVSILTLALMRVTIAVRVVPIAAVFLFVARSLDLLASSSA